MGAAPKMHSDQIDVDEALVHRLLAVQFPQYAHLPLRQVTSWATVNAVFRLGEEMVVRVPLQPGGGAGNERECDWLPVLAPRLPVRLPHVVGKGRPQGDYPATWCILSWLDGQTPASVTDGTMDSLADELADFLLALQRIEPAGAPPVSRGHVATADHQVREAIKLLEELIDTDAATDAWERAILVDPWTSQPVWAHGDFLPGNVLLSQGCLAGIIDFGAAGVGDPACDLMIAWHLLSPAGRARFRDALGVDDATWARGRGWALAQGLIALPYYKDTNPGMAASARHVITEVVRDHKRAELSGEID